MKIELKPIIDQLNEYLGLSDHSVAAIINEENDNELIGWTIVKKTEKDNIEMTEDDTVFETISELINCVLW